MIVSVQNYSNIIVTKTTSEHHASQVIIDYTAVVKYMRDNNHSY